MYDWGPATSLGKVFNYWQFVKNCQRPGPGNSAFNLLCGGRPVTLSSRRRCRFMHQKAFCTIDKRRHGTIQYTGKSEDLIYNQVGNTVLRSAQQRTGNGELAATPATLSQAHDANPCRQCSSGHKRVVKVTSRERHTGDLGPSIQLRYSGDAGKRRRAEKTL